MVNLGGLNDEPAPTALVMPEELKAARLVSVLHQSETWKLVEWSAADLVLSRSALKHMLALVEREMGQRKMIAPTRVER